MNDMDNTPEHHSNETPNETPKETLFSSGTFVIGLIVIGLFITLITWSVSFAALFFGAIGTFLSVASCSLDHENLRFQAKRDIRFSDENWAYFLMRALVGSVIGTAISLFALDSIEASHWANIAVLSMAGAFVFDYILFKRHCHKD